MPKQTVIRRVFGAVCGVGLAVFLSGAAQAASVTINDVSDDFTLPFSYDSSGLHHDTVAVHVVGGDFYIRFTLVPVSGAFRRLNIGIEHYVSPENALPSGHTIEGTGYSSIGTYFVGINSRRWGPTGTITYNLLINTVFQLQPSTHGADGCDPVDPPTLTPIPAGAVLFGSGLAFLGLFGRKRKRAA